MRPTDVTDSASFVAAALRPGADLDWTVPAGPLEWDVVTTVAHAASATGKYALTLASGSARFIPFRLSRYDDASNAELLDGLVQIARSLANLAELVPPQRRAFHVAGMADTSGFLAMGCCELIVHGWDAAQGLGLPYDPPDDLCRTVLSRLFPWTPTNEDAWTTLLWTTGRADLPGHDRVGRSWSWHCEPLEEWDGEVAVRRPPPPSAYLYDERTSRWLPHP